MIPFGSAPPLHVTVRWYGAFNAGGFVLALVLILVSARRAKIERTAFAWMLATVGLAGVAGGRLLYVLLEAPSFARACVDGGGTRTVARLLSDCTLGLQIWRGGMVLYGALLLGTLAGIVYARARRWPYWTLADLFAIPVAVGIAVGRLGCFFAGCCFGKPTDLPWAVHPAAGTPAALQYGSWVGGRPIGLHPTPLYEAAGVAVLVVALLWVARRQRKGGRAPAAGAVALTFLFGYAALRFAVEMVRGDTVRGFVATVYTPSLATWLHIPDHMPTLLSTSQLASLILVSTAAVLARTRRA
jgi:phosphatidylglycerol:prolipoprotein diacylglycerol transferase